MQTSARMLWKTAVASALVILAGAAVSAQKKNDVGVTDTEIKIGNIAPYSGPGSSYSIVPKVQASYFRMINEQGGINGRKINFIAYDDGYSPPKTVEQARKLVESDEVFALFQVIGTPGNVAIQKYVNSKGVPHIFVGSGAGKWADPRNYPWTMGWQPNYPTEARIYARHILENYPNKTVGLLYQNDDFGREYQAGLREIFGNDAARIMIAEVSFEATAPTVDSQVAQIRAANPDIFINIGSPKFAAQAIKKVAELDWKPVQFLTNIAASISGVLKPAGLQNSQGIISAAYVKDPNDAQWKNDPSINEWRDFMTRWYPEGDRSDALTVVAYGAAKGLVEVLKQCGDDMTRANLMKQMARMSMEIDVYLPGIRIKTSPTDFSPIEQLQLMRFKGETWELFGPVLSGSVDP